MVGLSAARYQRSFSTAPSYRATRTESNCCSECSTPLSLCPRARGSPALRCFLKLNPLGQIPVLEDNDLVLADSNAIMVYLVKRYAPGSFWLPEDPDELAPFRWPATRSASATLDLRRLARVQAPATCEQCQAKSLSRSPPSEPPVAWRRALAQVSIRSLRRPSKLYRQLRRSLPVPCHRPIGLQSWE